MASNGYIVPPYSNLHYSASHVTYQNAKARLRVPKQNIYCVLQILPFQLPHENYTYKFFGLFQNTISRQKYHKNSNNILCCYYLFWPVRMPPAILLRLSIGIHLIVHFSTSIQLQVKKIKPLRYVAPQHTWYTTNNLLLLL